ncbi:uncharacterized protein A1O9_02955 [Exophiala aquamarina CBS 119918]|uniref:NAD(P)-binding protein n=1 Tax=Exophiala aquamarina CBS 119918 TaxID=1182545 RepID=A0A072PMT7_9EURO|nr:uncharacterized protein A1O9_02955 [Exophiala aquamarina CBS 119918]KEF61389.1 hypothetical protein A1O9_02955 [Exophiala aquamarina CBS 119918]
MIAPASTIYLVSGASRGLGRALVAAYLARPNNTVIATVRDPTSPVSKSLQELSKGTNSSLIVLKTDSLIETDAQQAIDELKSVHNITSLDVVIANAGIAKLFPTVQEVRVEDILEHYRTNVIGVVLLFQAVVPLLKNSTKTPKFVVMGSEAGSIGGMEQVPVPNAAYGPSKAALNWITKKIHVENPDIIAFPIHPGFVQTDTGNASARAFGMEKAILTYEESIPPMVKLIDEATREATSGKFKLYDGSSLDW